MKTRPLTLVMANRTVKISAYLVSNARDWLAHLAANQRHAGSVAVVASVLIARTATDSVATVNALLSQISVSV